MEVGRNKSGDLEYIYTRTGDEPDQKQTSKVTLSRWDVLHIPGLGFDGLVGYSPIAMAKNAIRLAIATEEYGVSVFSTSRWCEGALSGLADAAALRWFNSPPCSP